MEQMPWYQVKQAEELLTPALLFYPERIKENLKQMIHIAGDKERLWPHIKTHKCAQIIKFQQNAGINKFKCATLTEAELLAKTGAKQALLAMQPTRVHAEKLMLLSDSYPNTTFSTVIDNNDSLEMISDLAESEGKKIHLWLDVNNGMNRTGIEPGEKALELFKKMSEDQWVEPMGFHVYDGHLRDTDFSIRQEKCQNAMELVLNMQKTLHNEGIEVKKIIAGGSPSFSVHAKNPELNLSPGTTLLWDSGYKKQCPDLPFEPAAVLATRVVSKPTQGIVCTDLGHKSLASEMNFPRIEFLEKLSCDQKGQSEEHFVLSCDNQEDLAIGQLLYALPKHICPTVSKYARAHVVEKNQLAGTWEISARDHEFF